MILLNAAGGYAFTRNPIFVASDDYEHQQQGINAYSVMLNFKRVFEGRFSMPFKIDISEIADIYSSPLPDISTGSNEILHLIETRDELKKRTVSFEYLDDRGNPSPSLDVIAIPGGIPHQNFKILTENGGDPFTARFLNRKGNYFLTTRTVSWRIVIPETELYPLYFIADKELDSGIAVRSIDGNEVWSSGALSAGLYALDLEAVRRRAFDDCDLLLSIFDIYTQGAFSCRIVISLSQPAKERYRLKFRNSLGVFEVIEIVGSLSWMPEFGSEDDDPGFDRRDSNSCAFSAMRPRIERRQSVTIDGIIKKRSELSFLMDMLASDEVYLLDSAARPVRVIPSIDEFQYRHRAAAPEPFSIKLTVSERDINIIDEMSNATDGIKPRVFSSQFNDKFN